MVTTFVSLFAAPVHGQYFMHLTMTVARIPYSMHKRRCGDQSLMSRTLEDSTSNWARSLETASNSDYVLRER